jgi:hypothetical protein
MKKIFVIIAGLLLIGTSAFAQGDLIVNGQLGVGASTPAAKADIDQTTSTGNTGALRTNLNKSTANFINASLFAADDSSTNSSGFTGVAINPWHTGSGALTGAANLVGATYNFQLRGSGTNINQYGAQGNTLWMRGAGNYSIANAYGSKAVLTSSTAVTNTLTNYYGYWSTNNYVAGTNNGTRWAGFFADDFIGWSGTVTDVAGLWIDQQTFGTNNYGIVLNGDGAGSDIVFGPTQSERIYSSAGRLYAQDSFGNQTILSPHDPETGEWIYYSKNIKTGKVVRVNMEKLVKAVEKLTGETFMIETFAEEK